MFFVLHYHFELSGDKAHNKNAIYLYTVAQ